MKIKHIRWMAIVGLLAIFGLQYVWLVNTYKLAKESIQFRSNEVFKDASMQELFHRMEELKAELKKKYAVQDTIVGVKVELDNDHDVAESGILNDNANQWLMSNMYVSIQEAVVKKYEVSVSLADLDSIYRANLLMEGIDAVVFTGGIGENQFRIRSKICKKLKFMGLDLDEEKNNEFRSEGKISKEDSKVEIWVVPTDEELMIAQDTLDLIK